MKSTIEDKAWRSYSDGMRAYQSREFATAQKFLEEALALYQELRHDQGEAAVLTNLGVTYSEVRRYDLAFDVLDRAICLHDKADNTEGLAKTLFSYASICAECGCYFRAIAQFKHAAELLKETGESSLAQHADASAKALESQSPSGLDDSSKEEYDKNMALLVTGMNEGEIHMKMDNPRLATESLSGAVIGAVALGLRENEAAVRNILGMAYFQVSDTGTGIKELKKAESIAQTLENKSLLGAILNNLGAAYSDLGKHQTAVQHFKRAIEARSSLVDKFIVTDTRINLGMAYLKAGQPKEALHAFEVARSELNGTEKAYLLPTLDQYIKDAQSDEGSGPTFIQKVPQKSQDIAEIFTEAQTLQERKEYEKAAELYEHASELVENNPADQATLQIACGYCKRRIGRNSEALLSYQRALSNSREAQNPELEARSLNNLGVIYASTDTEVGLSYLRKALSIREQLENPHELGETCLSIAGLLDDVSAQKYLIRAMALISPKRAPTAWVAAYRRIKEVLPKSIANEQLRPYRETAHSLGIELDSLTFDNFENNHEFITFGDDSWGFIVEAPGSEHRLPEFQWKVRRTKAELLWETKKREEAIMELRLSIEEIEQLREATTLPEQRRISFAETWYVYDQLIFWLNETGQQLEAIATIERVKTRELNATLSHLNYVPFSAPSALRAEHRAAILECHRTQKQIEELQKDSATTSPEYIKSAWRMHYEASVNLKSIQERISQFNTNKLKKTSFQTPEPNSISASVRSDDHAFVIYWLGTQLHGAFLLTHSDILFFPLDLDHTKEAIVPYQRCLDELSATGPSDDVCSMFNDLMLQYGGLFFAEISDSLKSQGIKKVTIIPHHSLHMLPIHSLIRTEGVVIEDFIVEYVPSFSINHVCVDRSSIHTSDRSVIISDPDGSLEYARLEGAIVKHFLLSSTVLGPGEASVEVLAREALSAEILHFACHGNFSPKDKRIGLKVSASQNHDGNMTLDEIMGALHLKQGSLVVLSACNSGRTLLGPTDDYVGLPGALLVAGARTVVCTLWPVDDLSTCILMWRFYKNLGTGMQVANALRTSQLWLRKARTSEILSIIEPWRSFAGLDGSDYGVIENRLHSIGDPPFSNPFYWGGFFCMGVGDVTVKGVNIFGD